MSFLLDPFLSVLLGVIFFSLSKRFHWKRNVTIVVTGAAAILATLYSVILYLDLLPSDIIILDTLRPIVQVLPQKGSDIMFHANVTGIHKDAFPVPLVVLFYALYSLWVYIGYKIMQNITTPRGAMNLENTHSLRNRFGAMILYLAGALLMLYGLMLPTAYPEAVMFVVGNVGIWALILGTYAITKP